MTTKKDAYYFSHDSSASRDIKMLKLKHEFGWEGIGLFWGIIETLRESTDYKFNSDQSSIQLLSTILGIDFDKLNKVINKCIELGLLTKDSKFFYSNSLNSRMQEMNQRREIGYKNGIKGGRPTTTNNPNHNPNHNPNKTQSITQTKPLKEKKEKKRKENTASADSFFSEWNGLSERDFELWLQNNQHRFEPATTRKMPSGRVLFNPRLDMPNPFGWGYSAYTGMPDSNVLSDEQRAKEIEQSKRNGTIL